jgi:3' terminal RNA ribose 2'-O-methyltransferase Hen1
VLLTISTTHRPATDLGYLLHKHPKRCQTFPLSFGEAHVYYPEASETRCTVALQVEVDPIRLVRRGRGSGGFALAQYVNDRPYVASSFLSVAIGEVFGSALAGRCRERPTLVEEPIPLEARISVVRARGDESLLRRLFLPLGYERVAVVCHPLDTQFPEWGPGANYTIDLATTARLQDFLRQLTVLLPVLDDDKHYWVGEDELEKLLRRGEGWLEQHQERELIANRYLRHRRLLVREAISRFAVIDDTDVDTELEPNGTEEDLVENPINLHAGRLEAVSAVLLERGARRVLDLGCGEGKLIQLLLKERQFAEIVGIDVSPLALETASRRLHLDQAPAKDRVTLLPGALTYRDRRLAGFDAAAVVEVVEHIEPSRLGAFERVLFESARSATVVLTTPNREYNELFPGMPAGSLRHRDHKFEWTRAEFQDWADSVGDRFGYAVEYRGIGPVDASLGTPTQMAIFTQKVSDEWI